MALPSLVQSIEVAARGKILARANGQFLALTWPGG